MGPEEKRDLGPVLHDTTLDDYFLSKLKGQFKLNARNRNN